MGGARAAGVADGLGPTRRGAGPTPRSSARADAAGGRPRREARGGPPRAGGRGGGAAGVGRLGQEDQAAADAAAGEALVGRGRLGQRVGGGHAGGQPAPARAAAAATRPGWAQTWTAATVMPRRTRGPSPMNATKRPPPRTASRAG